MDSVLDIFVELAKIPSQSLKEDMVADKIIEILKSLEVECSKDNYGNVMAKIPANKKGKPILLSAHMDVVGDMSPVNIQINGDIIETDKKRTLGADNKAGIASIIWAIKKVKEENISHSGIEILFTRDEEVNMSGIKHAEFEKFNSKYVLTPDSDALGNIEYAGADYTIMQVSVETLKGGHSGNDIWDKTRINAANLISEVIYKLPSGLQKKDKSGTVTSLNLGVMVAGGVKWEEHIEKQENFAKYLVQNGVNNIINQNAYAIYSIRSSSKIESEKLKKKIAKTIEKINKKYKNLAQVEVTYKEHLPMFEKAKDDTMVKVLEIAGKNIGLKTRSKSFHAGAETHIWANKKNSNGEFFAPILMGCADISSMHSPNESMSISSLEKGATWLFEAIKVFN